MNTFGKQLRELRRARKLTVNQLAVYSGVSSATISRIENGHRGIPKPATIRKLADTLKIPYEELMARKPDTSRHFRKKSAKPPKAINPSAPSIRPPLTEARSICRCLTAKSGSISQKKILKASANTLILSRLKRKSAPRIPHPLFDPLLNLTSARRTFPPILRYNSRRRGEKA